MQTSICLFGLAAIMVGIIPLMPKMVKLRIFILRKLRFRWLADWHQKHFEGIVIAARTIIAVIALILLGLGIDSLS